LSAAGSSKSKKTVPEVVVETVSKTTSLFGRQKTI
jgi:hypothetical protein